MEVLIIEASMVHAPYSVMEAIIVVGVPTLVRRAL